MDSESRLKILSWADSQSQMNYSAFSNVVIFDSTYRVNRYNLSFILFVEVNHHQGTVVFACVFLNFINNIQFKLLLTFRCGIERRYLYFI
jgi:hypothetical protein